MSGHSIDTRFRCPYCLAHRKDERIELNEPNHKIKVVPYECGTELRMEKKSANWTGTFKRVCAIKNAVH